MYCQKTLAKRIWHNVGPLKLFFWMCLYWQQRRAYINTVMFWTSSWSKEWLGFYLSLTITLKVQVLMTAWYWGDYTSKSELYWRSGREIDTPSPKWRQGLQITGLQLAAAPTAQLDRKGLFYPSWDNPAHTQNYTALTYHLFMIGV